MHHRLALVHDGDPGTKPVRALGRSLEERFWGHVEKTDGCWLWTGKPADTGYGTLNAGSRTVYAHRVSYELQVGPIPDGLHLDHLCRVRHCVNPQHLEPVTPRENQMRGIGPAAVNKRKTHCIHGHEFTPENIYFRPDNGNRQCRTCNEERSRRRSQRSVA